MDRRIISFALAAGVILLDRLTKIWIQTSLPLGETIPVIPDFFDIVHVENRGMAFGLFSGGDGAWRPVLLVGLASVVLLFVAGMIWRLPEELRKGQRFAYLSLGLILGGAAGNLYDRAVARSVTDFLDVYVGPYHWPAFNVADSAITVGAILLGIDLFWPKKENSR